MLLSIVLFNRKIKDLWLMKCSMCKICTFSFISKSNSAYKWDNCPYFPVYSRVVINTSMTAQGKHWSVHEHRFCLLRKYEVVYLVVCRKFWFWYVIQVYDINVIPIFLIHLLKTNYSNLLKTNMSLNIIGSLKLRFNFERFHCIHKM